MPRNPDIRKVLLIGSGPIMIGQAAEFDFSGSQACRSLREEGISVVLINSNPATIMTDPEMADAVYIEPIKPEIVERIIEKERPDGVIAGLGGQTGLNVVSELADRGVLEKYNVKLYGTPLKAIQDTEDRDLFKQAMQRIGEPVPRSKAVNTNNDAVALIDELGLPLVIRPAYTLGGAGGGIARTKEELISITELGLKRSRINQVLIEEGVLGWKEFDYCTVHAVAALREEGIETHIINNNPETVSTDYDTSDKLFFEPLTLEDVMNVIERDRPWGVMVQFGGQTSVNLALPLERELQRRTDLDTVILGTTPGDMDLAENKELFNKMLQQMGIPQHEAGYATSESQAREVAADIGYPVLVRPSYVLGGRAMEIVYDENDLNRYMHEAVRVSPKDPVLIDDFLEGSIEIGVDAVCDGEDVLIGAIMEHIKEAGIHSGDSACVIPPQSLGKYVLDTVRDYVRRIALALRVKGILNIQMAYKDRVVYVLEANPRSSRTIPFVSKAVGLPLAKIAAKAMMGISLKEQGFLTEPVPKNVSVKEVLLPFDKLPGADPLLDPEMRSTGEVMGVDYSFGLVFFKAGLAADNALPMQGKVFMSIRDHDKPALLQVARKMADAGLELIATSGTAQYLARKSIAVTEIKKVHEGGPNIIDMMRAGDVGLIINTPTGKMTHKDGRRIRRAAVDYAVPYITTIQAAMAAADAIEAMSRGELSIKSIGEYHSEM
ncbi:MAG: carbamoyl-phosphate synthase large subunit [ANME-2 cluster archaeon]|nr:carbamoyl-phosphate synthase large subunit [ANME-2 cluster archaeon]